MNYFIYTSHQYRPCLIISFRRVSVPDAFLFLSLEIWSWISFTLIGAFKISSDRVVLPRLFGKLTVVCDSWISSASYKRFWKYFVQSSGGISELSSIEFCSLVSRSRRFGWNSRCLFHLEVDFFIVYTSFLLAFCISFWE